MKTKNLNLFQMIAYAECAIDDAIKELIECGKHEKIVHELANIRSALRVFRKSGFSTILTKYAESYLKEG